MNQPDSFPRSPEFGESLEEILRRHTVEQFRSGVYEAWIELVDRYFGGESPEEQAKLSTFARSELPLAAAVWRDIDNRYPGVHAYFLVKVHPASGERIKVGPYGTEPIIVAFVDDNGSIVDNENRPRPITYSDEQVQVVVRQAQEFEMAGYSPNPRPQF